MVRRNSIVKFLILGIVGSTLLGCVSVKEYQKMYLNDKRMETASQKVEKFEIGFESYREGVAGASGGKSGGGCGCN